MPTRPILTRFATTPFIANEPLDAERVRDVLPRQVQVAFRPDAPRAQQVVPLTPAATQLLNGPDRVAARRFFTGVIDAARGAGALTNLRGMSLADGDAGFATNALASNIEAGYLPNSVATGDRARFLHDFQGVADATRGARAQNTGWLDVGPKVSAGIREIITRGPRASTDTLDEVSLVLTHELQHAATPPGPDIPQHLVWLEEGIAETLAWWPGAARGTLSKVAPAVPAHWNDPDPFTVNPNSLASPEYRRRNQIVEKLVSLAGVEPRTDDGAIAPGSADAARTLLQSSHVSGVPRDLARAIARTHRLDPNVVGPMSDAIAHLDESPDGVAAIERMIAEAPRR